MAKNYSFIKYLFLVALCVGIALSCRSRRVGTGSKVGLVYGNVQSDLFYYPQPFVATPPYCVPKVIYVDAPIAHKVKNVRDAVRQTYLSQIGVRELTGHNDGKAVEMYLRYCGLKRGEPWCASFVCWSLGQNHVPNPKAGYCPDLFTAKTIIFKRNGSKSLTPMAGDAMGIYFPEKERIAHTGFVHIWGDEVTITVEGNTNEGGSREGDGVYRKRRLTRQIYAVARFVK